MASTNDPVAPFGDPSLVFVVHGRNERARDALYTFLRALRLHPLEWNEVIALTGKSSPYIGDALDAGFQAARAAVVLITGDDEARLRDQLRAATEETETLQPQARPNVLFEAGMAMGRYPERTILVELGSTRGFSDIAGRHSVHMNNSIERRNELAAKLEIAGCRVSRTGTDWTRVGDFDSALIAEESVNVPSPWDESRYFSEFEEKHGAALTKIARDLYKYWADQKRLRIRWGVGAQYGSYSPVVWHKGAEYTLGAVYTYGKVDVNFAQLMTTVAFSAEAQRHKLIQMIDEQVGVTLDSDAITRRPSIPLERLKQRAVFEGFIRTMDWVIDEIRGS